VAIFEPQVTFASDPTLQDGWFCVACGRKHPESERIMVIYEKWVKEDVFPYL